MIDRMVLVMLLTGCALFAAITIAEIGWRRDPAGSALAVATLPRAAPLPRHRQPRHEYDELLATILARPLFSSTRRPPPPSGRDAAADSGLADTRLTGIVIAPGHRIAIFAPIGDQGRDRQRRRSRQRLAGRAHHRAPGLTDRSGRDPDLAAEIRSQPGAAGIGRGTRQCAARRAAGGLGAGSIAAAVPADAA